MFGCELKNGSCHFDQSGARDARDEMRAGGHRAAIIRSVPCDVMI